MHQYISKINDLTEPVAEAERISRGFMLSSNGPQAAHVGTRQGRLNRFTIGIVCFFLISLSAYWGLGPHKAARYQTKNHTPSSRKDLVIASYKSQDVSWIKEIPSDWTIKRYLLDEQSPKPSGGLPVPRNFGREAMAYLTYIIDHYDNLPDYAAFIHGHYRGWHQQAPISAKVRALNLTALGKENYVSFRCEDSMGCERRPFIDTYTVEWEGERHLRQFWNYMLPNVELPRYLSYKCCGQHAVTAKAIRTRSKDDWIRIREPLIRDMAELEATEEWAQNPPVNEYLIGSWYEKLWHVLLGTDPEYCPSVEHCRQVHFSNAVVCGGDQDLSVFSGDLWKENRCITAFDNVAPDAEVDWDTWYQDFGKFSQALDMEKQSQWQDKETRIKELEDEVARLKAGGKSTGV